MKTGTLQQVIEKSPYAAAGGTGFAVLTLNEWAVIVGIVATILTTLCSITFSWYFKRKRFRAFEKYLENRGRLGEVLDGEFDDCALCFRVLLGGRTQNPPPQGVPVRLWLGAPHDDPRPSDTARKTRQQKWSPGFFLFKAI